MDEAQETRPEVLNEIRLLSSWMLDSKLLLVVVLAGDPRLLEGLRRPELLALSTRIRVRTVLSALEPEELGHVLSHLVQQAGNAQLLTQEVARALCDHAAGNASRRQDERHFQLGGALQLDNPLRLDC